MERILELVVRDGLFILLSADSLLPINFFVNMQLNLV